MYGKRLLNFNLANDSIAILEFLLSQHAAFPGTKQSVYKDLPKTKAESLKCLHLKCLLFLKANETS